MHPSSQTAHYRDAMAFLASRENYERIPQDDAVAFQLASMRELLERLGNPQNALPVIHIAGTKGKGSTAAMLAAVCGASGHRVGLYTSPHLDRVEERFVVDQQPIDQQVLADLLMELKPITEAMDQEPDWIGPTYFEVATAVAMLYFVVVFCCVVMFVLTMRVRVLCACWVCVCDTAAHAAQ